MAIHPEVRGNVEDFDTEGAADATDKPSPASSATASDAPEETWDQKDVDQTHEESPAYDGLSQSSMSDNSAVLAMQIPEAPHPQPSFMIHLIDQSPSGSWDHTLGQSQGGEDFPRPMVAAPIMPYNLTQLPPDASSQIAVARPGNSPPDDSGYRSDSTDSVVSNSSEVSMDVNNNGYASEESRARGRAGRRIAAIASSDTRPSVTRGDRVPSPDTHVREFDKRFSNLIRPGNTQSRNEGSSSGV